MGKKVVRQSNFELLRIISMAMIVGLHYFNGDMGGALNNIDSNQYNYYVTYLLESFFIVGVNCFLLITGYFQIEKQSIKISKVVDLVVQMVFYGLLFYILALISGWAEFSIIGLLKSAIPIIFGLKWFIKVFIILYLLIPFINIVLNKLTKSQYQSLLLMVTIFFSVWPSFLPAAPVNDNGYGIINFILLYAIGGYVRKFYAPERSKTLYFSGYVIFALITFTFSIVVSMVIPGALSRVWGYNFIFNILGSVCLFLFFSKIKLKSKMINYIASFTLGVYFVHTEPSFYPFVYNNVLNTDDYWLSPWFIVHAMLSIVMFYGISTIIDIGRKKLFDIIGPFYSSKLKNKYPFLWETKSIK